MIWFFINITCLILYFVIWFIVIFFGLVFFEKKKHFINTKFVYKYNPYTFIRNLLLQLAFDFVYYDPNAFKYKGIVIYEGEQGNGKTISLVHDVFSMLKEYPSAILVDNLAIHGEESTKQKELLHWKQLLTINNGSGGVICVIDETQNWFSSKDSKNFPPEMLSVVTQNRKNRRIILGTAQQFYMLSKDIRTQTTELRSCFTLFGCVSGYIRKKPYFDSEGNVLKYKFLGINLFVHSNQLRRSYDTYKVIKRFSDVGFNDKDK